MIRLTVVALTIIITAAGEAGMALAAADCGLVRDPDKRRACFAERDRRPGDCGLIRDSDERRICYVRAERR